MLTTSVHVTQPSSHGHDNKINHRNELRGPREICAFAWHKLENGWDAAVVKINEGIHTKCTVVTGADQDGKLVETPVTGAVKVVGTEGHPSELRVLQGDQGMMASHSLGLGTIRNVKV